MGPKAKSGKEKKKDKGPKKRTLEKQKQKVFEDKTFGMKNKNKSKKVQNYIKGMQKATFMGSKSAVCILHFVRKVVVTLV